MTFDEEPETQEHPSLLPDTHLTLGTIEEAREGSTSGESEDFVENEELPEEQFYERKLSTFLETTSMKDRAKDEREVRKTDFHLQNDDEEEENDQFQEEEYNHPDIDGGWAWVVLVSVFCIFALSSGGFAASGLYFSQMLIEFGESRSYTAWIGSLMNAFFMLVGPLSSIIIQRFGCRATMLLGSVIMTTGYLASSLAPSLNFLFFSYGFVVAVGLNCTYSGQIIALAQYFHKRHSIATSITMIGIGAGVFCLIPMLEMVIEEYGWRGSFIINAGLGLQVSVFAALVIPLRKLKPSKKLIPKSKTDEEVSLPVHGSHSHVGHHRNRGRISQSLMMHRSISSLKLSLGAGYLSNSLASLNESRQGVPSNPSFCSRGSNNTPDVRSNQHSFCHSHMEFGWLPSLRSNQHSFCSRDSYNCLQSIRSNPHSFSIKNSQIDLQHHFNHCKDNDIESALRGKKYFQIMNGCKECNLSICKEDCTEQEADGRASKCNLMVKKISAALYNALGESSLPLMVDPSFWLLNFTVFFSMLSTIKLFIVYKDLCTFLGAEDYYSTVMSTIGVGDVCGRLLIGVITSFDAVSPVICYSVAITICGLAIALHLIVVPGPIIYVVAALFGVTYGAQNILFTVVPATLFGRDKLVVVFGYALFWAGLGALVGAPIDGYIVDVTGSYFGVVIISVIGCFIGGILLLICYLLRRLKKPKLIIEPF